MANLPNYKKKFFFNFEKTPYRRVAQKRYNFAPGAANYTFFLTQPVHIYTSTQPVYIYTSTQPVHIYTSTPLQNFNWQALLNTQYKAITHKPLQV